MRPAVEADYLHSYLRSRILSTIEERQVSGDLIVEGMELDENTKRKYVLNDEKNKLVDWQDHDALHHWKLMREVLPNVYWETY